jgi:uncharacterized protein (TIGR03000 family)
LGPWRFWWCWAFYPFYGGYDYYPSYYPSYTYDSYPYGSYSDYSNYDTTAGIWSLPTYNGGYYTYTGPQSIPGVASDKVAHVTVNVPADAQVWFDDRPTTTTGAVRHYETPALAPSSHYAYEIRARWNDNGREVTQTQKVDIRAGASVRVDFPLPQATATQMP